MGANGGALTVVAVLLCIVAIAVTGPAFLPSEESTDATTATTESVNGDRERVLDVAGDQNVNVEGKLPGLDPLNGGSVFGFLAAAVFYLLAILYGAGRQLVRVATADGSSSTASTTGGGGGLPPELLVAAVAIVALVGLVLARRRGLTPFAASPLGALGRWGDRIRDAGIAAVLALAETLPTVLSLFESRRGDSADVPAESAGTPTYESLPSADENEVYRAWHQFASSLPSVTPDRPPREHVAAAAEHGLPVEAVDELAAQFRAVRYGDREPDASRTRRVREAVGTIEDALLDSREGDE